jgi:putative transposase
MKGKDTIGQENLKYFYVSRNLPHMFDIRKPVFITYRLKFTLPAVVMKELNQRKTEWLNLNQKLDAESKKQRIKHREATFFDWYDKLIAQSSETPQILHQREITDIITESFRYFDNQHYTLMAYCVMPNHVHVLIHPLLQESGEIYSCPHITYTWKRYSANQINRVLKRSGSLWQQESYDHMVRDERELSQVLEYIIQNPVMAGLVNKWDEWYGTWVQDKLKPQ